MTGPEDLPPPDITAGEAGRRIDEILARAEFQRQEPTLLERARDWVFEQLDRLISTFLSGDRGAVVAWIGLAVGAAAAAYFVVRMARGIQREPEGYALEFREPRRTAAEWRAEAESHERAGEWRLALRCRYRALLAELATRGLVEEIPGRTTGEYRGDVSVAVPAVASDFSVATELFELAWYGDRPTGEGDTQQFRHLEGKVLQGAST